MESEPEKPKFGAGHAAAMGRLGIQELRGMVYPDSNVAQQSEYGLYGTMTPGEVAADRQDKIQDLDNADREGSILQKHLNRPDPRDDRDEDREPDLDR